MDKELIKQIGLAFQYYDSGEMYCVRVNGAMVDFRGVRLFKNVGVAKTQILQQLKQMAMWFKGAGREIGRVKCDFKEFDAYFGKYKNYNDVLFTMVMKSLRDELIANGTITIEKIK